MLENDTRSCLPCTISETFSRSHFNFCSCCKGAVVAAAEILDDDEATNTAATLKVIQNAVLGLVVVGITILWKPKDSNASMEALSAKKLVPETGVGVELEELNNASGHDSGGQVS